MDPYGWPGWVFLYQKGSRKATLDANLKHDSDSGLRYRIAQLGGGNSNTPPKTNMEPENGPLEKEIPIGNYHFISFPCFRGCIFYFHPETWGR